jgi:hypothetical protein
MIVQGCWFQSFGVETMKRIRFNIASLLIVIFLLGVGFAALRESSDLWDSGVFTLTLGVLLISILLGVDRTEARRAFWIGFALFGWIYLGISLAPSIQSRLMTTKALAYLDSKVPRSSPAGLTDFDPYATGSWDVVFADNLQPNALVLNKGNGGWIADVRAAGSNQTRFTNILAGRSLTGFGTTENFIWIGHSLLAIVAALMGGQLSRYLHQKNRKTT